MSNTHDGQLGKVGLGMSEGDVDPATIDAG
jgi:hypothetical protein